MYIVCIHICLHIYIYIYIYICILSAYLVSALFKAFIYVFDFTTTVTVVIITHCFTYINRKDNYNNQIKGGDNMGIRGEQSPPHALRSPLFKWN